MSKKYEKIAKRMTLFQLVFLIIIILSYIWLMNVLVGFFFVLSIIVAVLWLIGLILSIILLKGSKKQIIHARIDTIELKKSEEDLNSKESN